jgi:hypothetical protein
MDSDQARSMGIEFGFWLCAALPRHWRQVGVHHVDRTKSTLLFDSLPLNYPMGAAEDFARREGVETLVTRDAWWRSDPATDKQIYILRKFRVVTPDGLTKGQASDMLSAIFGDAARK